MAARSPRRQAEIRIARDEDDLAGHFRVRREVFVEEQGIFDETDRDLWDTSAIHVVAALGPLVVGAVRLFPLDEAGLWQGDRLAVTRDARRLRAGGPLVRFAVETAGLRGGARMIARVQEPNVAFFQHLGWSCVSGLTQFHGIPHQRMQIPLAGAPAAFSAASYGWALG